MYDELLRGLFEAGNFTTAESQTSYLQSLQQGVKALRQGYAKYPVEVNYADHAIQAAYLLAYFPHYTEPLYEVFKRTPDAAIPARLSLFGTGPCPEVIGLLRYIRDYLPHHSDALDVTTYDIRHDDWAWSRNVVLNHVVPSFRGLGQCNFLGRRLDLSTPFLLEGVGTEFCVFQNCLNEIPQGAWDAFARSVIDLYRSLQPGSWICMIHAGERIGQQIRVDDLVVSIQRQIAAQYPLVVIVKDMTEGSEAGLIRHRSGFGYPPLTITQHLLTTQPRPPWEINGDPELLPNRNVFFRYSLIRRP